MNIHQKSSSKQDYVLIIALFLTLLLTAVIPVLTKQFDLTLLDTISNPNNARDVIAHMNPTQIWAHIWLTATLDVAYPLLYGVLFVGSALRFFPHWGIYLAVPAVLAVVADLSEGVVQILGLSGISDLLYVKQFLTPFKFGMALVGLFIAAFGLITYLMKSREK